MMFGVSAAMVMGGDVSWGSRDLVRVDPRAWVRLNGSRCEAGFPESVQWLAISRRLPDRMRFFQEFYCRWRTGDVRYISSPNLIEFFDFCARKQINESVPISQGDCCCFANAGRGFRRKLCLKQTVDGIFEQER